MTQDTRHLLAPLPHNPGAVDPPSRVMNFCGVGNRTP